MNVEPPAEPGALECEDPSPKHRIAFALSRLRTHVGSDAYARGAIASLACALNEMDKEHETQLTHLRAEGAKDRERLEAERECNDVTIAAVQMMGVCRIVGGREYIEMSATKPHSLRELITAFNDLGMATGKLQAVRWLASDQTQTIAAIDAARQTAEPHVHEWTDARNEVVMSGEMCKCGAIRAGNRTTNASPEGV